ncbi:MAG: carboxypeptidase regulatory-like domain-containing protein, partial [Gammaproteobacteria bacterium]
MDAPAIYVDYISPFYYGGSTYALEMWQMSVDWSTSTAAITGPTATNVNPFNDGDFSCAPQPSPGECLPVLGDRLMYRLAYRNGMGGDGHQVLLTDHAVTTNGTSAPIGINWYELDAPANSTDPTQWSLVQQAVYAPADGNSRFMGSISMDHVGNIALGYTISGSSMDPSVAVTGQNVGAPSGTMDAPEQILITGSGVQEATGRWGDYSAIMASATDDCTFWTAQEYISNTGSFLWSTGNGNLKFSNCSIGPVGTITGQVTDSGTGSPIAGATVTLTPGGDTAITNSSGNYTMTVPVNTYSAAYSDFGYTTGNISGIGVTDGGTITENIALTLAPVATVSGNVNDATPSGHTYGLYSEVKVTAPAFGQVADIWTNPQGAYSLNLPEGSDYTFKATVYLPGYNPGSATVTNLSGNTTQNIGVAVNAANCTAPGYMLIGGVSTGFEGTFPPTGWTVVNDVDNGFTHWERNDSYSDANFTNGSGFAAEANDDHGGPGLGAYSTQLITPPINVTSLAGTVLTYTANYAFLGTSELDLDISTDGGATWTNIQAFNTGTGECGSLYATPGCNISVDIGSYLPGSGTFQLRWHFYSTSTSAWDWYAQIDNILLGAGCSPIPGGLVEGSVTDMNTSSGLVGATVADSNTPSNSVKTATNAADPNLPAAYYFLFSNANASDVITASDSGYGNGTATLNVTDNSVTPQNFALGAPLFNATPPKFWLHVMVNTQVQKYLTINNTGSADGTYSFLTFNNAPPASLPTGGGAALSLIQCTRLAPQS